MDIADLPTGGREEGIAFVPFHRHQLGQGRRHRVDRVTGQVRVGNMALHALDRELAAHGAAPAVLDHVTGALDRRGLAHNAIVQHLTARL